MVNNCINRHCFSLPAVVSFLNVFSSFEAREKKAANITYLCQIRTALYWVYSGLALKPIQLIGTLIAVLKLQTVNTVVGLWKTYLRGCQTQLQSVSYSRWPSAKALAILHPPTTDQASVYTNLSALFSLWTTDSTLPCTAGGINYRLHWFQHYAEFEAWC